MTQLGIHRAAASPSPGDFAGYLLQRGWTHKGTTDFWASYSKVIAGDDVVLEVPQKSSSIGYSRAAEALLSDLARLEERSEEAILRDVLSASLDVIRISIRSSATSDGRIPVAAGTRVFEATRNLFLAAACSVLDPRPVFTARKPDEAMRLLDRAKFGQTEVGSFVITVECKVPPRLGQQSFLSEDEDVDAPFERRTTLRLFRALDVTKTACLEAAASNKLDPFVDNSKNGVSANLCEAVAELLEASGADSVSTSVAFASRRPVTQEVSTATAFTADNAPVLREAATKLRQEATYEAIELVGTLVKLVSPNPPAGGNVVLRTDVEGKRRDVQVSLNAETYKDAVSAHGDGQLVRMLGDLKREGRTWNLFNARGFSVVPVSPDDT